MKKEKLINEIINRIQAIVENWQQLIDKRWDNETLTALKTRMDEVISRTAEGANLTEIHEDLSTLQEYLTTFLQNSNRLSAREIENIEQLLSAIISVSKTLSIPSDVINADETVLLYFLSANRRKFNTLLTVLEEKGLKVVCFADAQAMMLSAKEEKPSSYLIDYERHYQLEPYIDDFKSLKTKHDTEPAKFFIANDVNIEIRLKALRTGAKWVISVTDGQEKAINKIINNTNATIIKTEKTSKVLIVEDDIAQAKYVKTILSKKNIEAIIVTKPLEVIDTLLSFHPDLILMDIYMPDANGIELTFLIREYKEFSQTPIVFLSGEDDPERQLEAISVGGDDFLTKPISPKLLLETVLTRIHRYKIIRQRTESTDKDTKPTLFGYQYFQEKVAQSLKTSHTETTAIFYFKIKDFFYFQKKIGIGGMDHLVKELGKSIDEQLNPDEIVAKMEYHGLAVLARRASNNKLVEFAEHLRQLVSHQTFVINHLELRLEVNIGICLFDENLDDELGLINKAESASNFIEAEGGSNVHVFSIADEIPKENATIFVRKLYDQVYNALANDSFTILYQPIINLQIKTQKNYQVQYYLFTERGREVSQQLLLRAAVETGNQPAVDQLILDRSFETHTQRKQEEGSQLFVPQSIESLLLGDGYTEDILLYMRRWHIVGQGIVLCFNYQDLKHDIKLIKTQFNLLKESGIQILIFNLAVSVNVLKVLAYLQVNYVVPSIATLKIKPKSLKGYFEKIHKLGAKIIIRHINKPSEFIYFWKSGADYIQGNFIQPPSERMAYDFSQNPEEKIKPLSLKNEIKEFE